VKKSIQNPLLALLVSTCLPASVWAQIFVDPNNNVGIGTTTPDSKFESYQDNNFNGVNTTLKTYSSSSGNIIGLDNYINSLGTGTRYGIRNDIEASSSNTNAVFGVYSDIVGSSGTSYGVYTAISQPTSALNLYGVRNALSSGANNVVYGEYTSINATNNSPGQRYGNYITMTGSGIGIRYGIYSNVLGAANYAGFFNGNLMVTGVLWNLSDARTKQHVRPIESALGTLQQLQPRRYEYRQDMGLGLPEGPQYGFIAQDLAKVLPELVQDTEAPIDMSADPSAAGEKSDGTGMPADPADPKLMKIKAVNYTALIPILTQAVQELADKVDQQAEVISSQTQMIEDLRNEISKR
jgi:Chaperone of endosialidase